MTTGWNEKSIREELARLDVKTGLKVQNYQSVFRTRKKHSVSILALVMGLSDFLITTFRILTGLKKRPAM